MRVELFSCAGGMAQGFRRAGLPLDLAIDSDPVHCDSYEFNIGHRPICVDARDLLRFVGALRPMLRTELVVADPPCTPWSRAGKRLGQGDERDMLGVTIELLAILQPAMWLVANVPGLDDEANWETVVQPVIGGFAQGSGYCVDFARLDAADYGVPQHRVRPFWFGHRKGSPCIRWPEPSHCDPALLATLPLPGVPALSPWVTCREALGHLPPKEMGRPVGRRRNEWPWERPATTVTADPRLPPAGHHDRWPWSAPATTVYAETSQLAAHGKGSPGSRPGAIALSLRAAKILQGFPEEWVVAGRSKAAQWRQVGQAMPPPLAAAVARSVAEQMSAATRRAA